MINIKRNHINYLAIIVTFIFAWSSITFLDYCQERHLVHSNIIFFIGILLIPIMIPILYLVFEKHINSARMSRAKNTLIIMGTWICLNAITGFVVCNKIYNDEWIIEQSRKGWNNVFNGVEYILFAYAIVFIPIIIVAIWRLIIFVNNIE